MTKTDLVSEREISLLSSLIVLQEDEQNLLRKADASKLAELGTRKLEIIEQLNELESARKNLLTCPDSKDMRAAMDDWLAGHPEEKQTATRWKKLLELAQQAKKTHDMNRRLVELHLQQTGELLSTLSYRSQRNDLYGSNGQAFATSGSRIVDSA